MDYLSDSAESSDEDVRVQFRLLLFLKWLTKIILDGQIGFSWPKFWQKQRFHTTDCEKAYSHYNL